MGLWAIQETTSDKPLPSPPYTAKMYCLYQVYMQTCFKVTHFSGNTFTITLS